MLRRQASSLKPTECVFAPNNLVVASARGIGDLGSRYTTFKKNARDDTVSTAGLNELSVEAVHKIAWPLTRSRINTMEIEREASIATAQDLRSTMILNQRSIKQRNSD